MAPVHTQVAAARAMESQTAILFRGFVLGRSSELADIVEILQ
jgi:hypothetical protein